MRQDLDPDGVGAVGRKPSSIHLLRGVRVMAAMSCEYRPPGSYGAAAGATFHLYGTVYMENLARPVAPSTPGPR